GHDVSALQRRHELAILIDGRPRRLARARQADADVGMLRLPRPVHHAAHHGHPEVLDPRVTLAPGRHLRLEVSLHVAGHLLEERAGRAAATGAGRDAGRVAPDVERLKYLLCYLDLALARSARVGRQRDADRVAD